jgi:mono/diheme cytochrome c family protein
MDFPAFHADLVGNRAIIAVIATLHVLINHGLAVGLMPLVATMEWHGYRTQDRRWDDLAWKLLFFAFLITTTLGALTGVGIWLSASLINPYAIGSLIRVFFWAWFTEWLVFITEVCLIVLYFLTWKKWTTGAAKVRHMRLGAALGLFSWITMAIIVSILGFMMDPGNWLTDHTLLAGFTNPIHLPQLAFRTPLALTMAGVVAAFLTIFFVKRQDSFRAQALRAINLWTLFFAPLTLAGGWWYASVVPESMKERLATALLTLQFESWLDDFYRIMVGVALAIYVMAQIAVIRPTWIPRAAYGLALVGIFWLTGSFERAREFVRKPYVIGQYLYANGIRVSDYPLLQRDGILAHSTYSYPLSAAEKAGLPPSQAAQVQRGKDVFMIACSRCHTGEGVNSVVGQFARLFDSDKWDRGQLADFTMTMHQLRSYMPPFPGTHEELLALSDYLIQLRASGASVPGAQEAGIAVNPAAGPQATRRAEASIPEQRK